MGVNPYFVAAFVILLITILIIFIIALARPCGEIVDGSKARDVSQIKVLAALKQDSRNPVQDHYIVTMKQSSPESPEALAQKFTQDLGFEVQNVYKYVVRGFSGRLDGSKVDVMRLHPSVSHVESDGIISAVDNSGFAGVVGEEVDVFLLDTGVQGETADAKSFVPDETEEDFNGHGTGTAKVLERPNTSHIHSFKVLDKTGNGRFSWAIAALDLVLSRETHGVVCLPFSSYVGTSTYNALDIAVDSLINAGIEVVAVGSDDTALHSPSHVTGVYCV